MNIALLQDAAKKIEADGLEGIGSAVRLVGMPMALALAIAHLRRGFGSMEVWPPDPQIDEQVNDLLQKEVSAVGNFLAQDCALFYTDQWYCFDNFSAFTVKWRGKLYPTAEHAYQAAKFDQETVVERIRNAPSAHESKKLGNDPVLQHLVRPNWQEVKHAIMEEILRAKLAQHEYVQKKLRASRGMLLVEDSHHDDHWGRGENWDGENRLGKIWMKIRDEL